MSSDELRRARRRRIAMAFWLAQATIAEELQKIIVVTAFATP
jgi:hypothetical protein